MTNNINNKNIRRYNMKYQKPKMKDVDKEVTYGSQYWILAVPSPD
jgi:hypothetical protein